jgi:hypothetical protein
MHLLLSILGRTFAMNAWGDAATDVWYGQLVLSCG